MKKICDTCWDFNRKVFRDNKEDDLGFCRWRDKDGNSLVGSKKRFSVSADESCEHWNRNDTS